MRPDQSTEDDARLSRVLREWQVDAALPPGFHERVWRRLEQADAPRASRPPLGTLLNHWITTLLPRPALAAAYVALWLFIGGVAGWTQARQEISRVSGELKIRYVQTVDPYQLGRY